MVEVNAVVGWVLRRDAGMCYGARPSGCFRVGGCAIVLQVATATN